MVNKKDKPNKKQNRPSEERDFLMPKKKFTKSDRQDEQDEIERGLDMWEYGEE